MSAQPEAAPTSAHPEIALLRRLARTTHQVARLQADGMSHADSLLQPRPAGNCLNWVLGHLLATDAKHLQLLGQAPVLPEASLARYDRGSRPLGADAAAEALPLQRLLEAWDETARRVDAGLAALPVESLGRPAPFSPSGNASETIGTLLSTIAWHQSYHAGQMAMLRRLAGRPGAIP